MKKKLTVLMLAFTMVFTMLAVTACGGGGQSEEKAEETGYGEGYVFKQGFDLDYRPYSFVDDNGENGGFDVEMAQAVCDYYGWKYEAVPFNWDAKDAELNAGSCDCIWSGFTINGREDAYTWSSPYVDNSQVVMVRATSPIESLADLAGKVVAVQTDTPVMKALQEGGKRAELGRSFKKLVISPNYNNAVMELEAGSVNAVALDIGVAQEKVKTGNFRILDEVVITEKYGIGFRKGNTALRDQVEKTLKEMVADGTAKKISEKYFDGRDCLIIGK